MSKNVTVCLLNYRRPKQLRQVIDSVKSQTVSTEIFLWDNAQHHIFDKRIDWQLDSNRNLFCWPRWWMAEHATSEVICTLDDDLAFKDPKVLKDGLDYLQSIDASHHVIGPFCCQLVLGKPYKSAITVRLPSRPKRSDRVDVVKGRHMMMYKTAIERLASINHPEFRNLRRGDDIAVCGILAGVRNRYHHRPYIYGTRFERFVNLEENDALCDQPEHYALREQARQTFFPGH